MRRLRITPKSVSPFKPQPPFRNVAKNDGPTCNPIKKTKRMRPKFLKNVMRSGFTSSPSQLKISPRKSTQVDPSDTPKNRIRPSASPSAITKEYTTIPWLNPDELKIKSLSHVITDTSLPQIQTICSIRKTAYCRRFSFC